MKKSEAIRLLNKYADEALNQSYSDRLFHNILFVLETMFGKESFSYTFLAGKQPNLRSYDLMFNEEHMTQHYRMRDEAIDHIQGCIEILKYSKPYKPPKKNIFSDKDNAAVLLAGIGIFFVGIIIGSQLSPEIVSLMERIRNVFV